MQSNNYLSAALPSSKTVASLYSSIKDGSLKVRPDFQRKLVWNEGHKVNFIDTILKNFPFPEVYISSEEIDLDKITSRDIVVDGQQRLTTIVEYIDGTLTLKKTKDTPLVPSFESLSSDDKKRFLNYPVTVRYLAGVDMTSIKEIFRRINRTQYALNANEVTQAIYDGEFIMLAKSICELDIFKNLPTFSDRELSRMNDLGFALLVMATIEHDGYFTYDLEIERYIKEYDSEYANGEKLYKSFTSLLSKLVKMKLEDDSIWYRKSNLFTLLVESLKAGKMPKKAKLLAFENNIIEARNSIKHGKVQGGDFATYYANMFTGTNSRQARVIRGDLLRRYVFEE